MTIGISCTLSEGIVLGADSAATISEHKVFNYAEKLFQMANWPVGVLTAGPGLLGGRTIKSHFADFVIEEVGDPGQLTRYHFDNTLLQIAEKVTAFFQRRY